MRRSLPLSAAMAVALLHATPAVAADPALLPPARRSGEYDWNDEFKGRTIRGPRVGRKPTKSMKKSAKKARRKDQA